MTEKSLPKNVFGKCLPVKIVVCLFWGLIALFCFIWAFGWSWDGESSAGWILLLFWLLCLVPILQMFAKKLIIEDDHITIKSWIIFKKAENIKYRKINNIEKSEAFWMWWLVFHTWNDKPVKFKNLECYDLVHDYINDKIEEKEK